MEGRRQPRVHRVRAQHCQRARVPIGGVLPVTIEGHLRIRARRSTSGARFYAGIPAACRRESVVGPGTARGASRAWSSVRSKSLAITRVSWWRPTMPSLPIRFGDDELGGRQRIEVEGH
jgi:hypothetical protein